MNENWYNNKELFELIHKLEQDMADLKKEMAETRTLIRDYNNLRGKINDTAGKINTIMWITPIAVAATGLLLSAIEFFWR
jgi:tetrahydromethanopterin S-methyltransferase subunit B